MNLATPSAQQRRYDLDWIRVGAFLLLILYHSGMFYVPWEWHVKSSHRIDALEPIMLFTHPWRMTLLFLVSGCATRFMADGAAHSGMGRLARSRTARLLPPLLFGMLVVVPPQTYFQVYQLAQSAGVADPAHSPVLADFYLRYITASGGWLTADGRPVVTPTWNHLWFVLYLMVYTWLLCLMLSVPGAKQAMQKIADRLFAGWGLILWPIAYLILIRFTLAPRFEPTYALVDDWYNHAQSFAAFLFGFFTARSDAVRAGLIRIRWPALAAALVSYAVFARYAWVYRGDEPVPSDLMRTIARVAYGLDQAAFIAAILGFGGRWLDRGGPVLRYLTVAIFPCYIVHQTVTVVAGFYLTRLHLPVVLEAVSLVGSTVAGCIVASELARRVGALGWLLGVKHAPARHGLKNAAKIAVPGNLSPKPDMGG